MQPLVAGPRSDLTVEEVESSLGSQEVRWFVDVLDLSDVETGETFEFESASVAWSLTTKDHLTAVERQQADARRTGEVVFTDEAPFDVRQRRFRVGVETQVPDVVPEVVPERVPGWWVPWHLGVFLPATPPRRFDGQVVRRRLVLVDKVHAYNRVTTDDWVVVPAGVVTDWLTSDLTSRFGESSFAVSSSARELDVAVLFPPNTPWLSVYNDVLSLIGFDQLTTDEEGRPATQALSAIYGKGSEAVWGDGVLLSAAALEPHLPEIPNVLRFVMRTVDGVPAEGNGIFTVRNETAGPSAVDKVGEIHQTVQVDAQDQAALEEAAAVLAQRWFGGGGDRVVGEVGFDPRLSDRDVVTIFHDDLGVTGGRWFVTSHSRSSESVTVGFSAERRVAV